MMLDQDLVAQRNSSTDRILVLEVMDGQKAKSSTGMTDPGLFSGENKLHAIKDSQTCLWYLKYERGVLPPAFKQQFTGFKALLKFVEDYYRKRNIIVKEVID